MSTGRDWRSFNSTWRNYPAHWKIWRWLQKFIWPIKNPQKFVERAEPWGILLAILVFGFDYSDSVEQRTVNAWQLLATDAAGTSGKKEALEYLNKESCILGYCYKERVPLAHIDLGEDIDKSNDSTNPDSKKKGVWLFNVDLRLADLDQVNFERATLEFADLSDAYLAGAKFDGADLECANLSKAELKGARFDKHTDAELVDFTKANLEGVDLANVDTDCANFSGVDLSRALNVTQINLRHACGDEETRQSLKKIRSDQELTIALCTDVKWYPDERLKICDPKKKIWKGKDRKQLPELELDCPVDGHSFLSVKQLP